MRIKTLVSGGYSTGGFSSPGGTLSGPLILARNPQEDLEAATKLYVDELLSTFSGTNFSTGTLQTGRLPAFTGDLVSTPGSNILSLGNSGISSGVFNKVTVNNKGLITNGFGLTESDLPDLEWNKITTGKPSTLSGYGITDALSKNGGALTGNLTLHSDPVDSMHAVTKQYAENKVNESFSLNTGDIIQKSVSVTPEGFLRCNGGQVSKTEYSALYSIIGDAYSISGTLGSGKPWRQQYLFNTTQSTDVTGWTTGTALPGTVSSSQAIVTKSRVYLLGGYINSSWSSTVYTAPINEDGTLGTWTTGTALPGALAHSQAIVTKNRVYLLGGYTNASYVSTVYTAPINEDGTLGTWTTGTALPGTVGHSQAIVTKSRVYLLGGRINNSNYSSTVYTAPINEDGTLGTWTTGTALPGTVGESQAIVTKNRVYLLGGRINNSNYSSTVYTAPINENGTLGTWTTGTALPGTVAYSQAIVTKNRVYLLGGFTGSAYSSTVYTAPINEDGTLGTWTTETSLPETVTQSQAIVTKSRVYLLGGFNGSTYSSTVYTASFSGGLNDYSPYYDGTITPTDPSNFRLPDLSSSELQGTYSYIKI